MYPPTGIGKSTLSKLQKKWDVGINSLQTLRSSTMGKFMNLARSLFFGLITTSTISACTPAYVYDETPESYQREALAQAEAAKLPLFIRKIEVGNPNYAGGISVNISGHNFGGKAIKYIRYTVTPYNRVGDRMSGEIRRLSRVELTETGPIAQSSTFGGGSIWDNVWYNHQISCVRISEIEIDYMDGSSLMITGKDAIDSLLRYDVRNPAC